MRTALELARQAGEFLGERGIENGRLEAELLLSAVLGFRRLDLYLQHDRPVDEAEVERYRGMVRRRLRREPLQYILGEVDFRQLRLKVDRRVLIPRPETEVLVGQVLKATAGRAGMKGLDIGTGSGAIAVSLAVEGGFDRIVATDTSPDALDIARENARSSGTADRVEFRLGSTWAALGDEGGFDVVVSNPPYIAEAERAALQPEVGEWEPPAALFGGADGLSVINEIIDGAAARLGSGGLLALEIGEAQGDAVMERIRRRGFSEPALVQDLAGRPRIVLAGKAPAAAAGATEGKESGDN